MIMFCSLLLAVISAWFLVAPHIMGASTEGEGISGSLRALGDHKARCVQILKDLELDFSTGKISQADYDRMRSGLTDELAVVLTKIDDANAPTR